MEPAPFKPAQIMMSITTHWRDSLSRPRFSSGLDADPRARARDHQRDQEKDQIYEDGNANAHQYPEQAPRPTSPLLVPPPNTIMKRFNISR
jgi:hypothetical protein